MNREVRYIVLKLKDADAALTECEKRILDEICYKVSRYRDSRHVSPLTAVVVEHDWPEYEPTWEAIERRMDGK